MSMTSAIEYNEVIRDEATQDTYEAMYHEDSAYDLPYQESHYYPMFRAALNEVIRLAGREVLEVGCGSGSFAQLLFDTHELAYSGFDFAASAIEKAGLRTGRPNNFYLGDARRPESYLRDYDTIVCTEVLEHIEMDRQLISNWRPGCGCVCSVPNFDDATHVRIFRHEREILKRYGHLIDIGRIIRVPRPLFRGRSFREYMRQLRWSRDNPKRFLAMLGYETFDHLAGWFVFSGRRKPRGESTVNDATRAELAT